MTKPREIALLDQTITAFGRDSYLGPWLQAHRDSIVTDITNDIEPDLPMPSDYRRQAYETIAAARAEAAQMHADAQKQAEALVAKARQDVDAIRQMARTSLDRLARQL